MRTPHVGITDRELQILKLMAEGVEVGNKTPVNWVAGQLRVSPNTVSTALWRLRRRYDKTTDFGIEYRRWKRKLKGKYL